MCATLGQPTIITQRTQAHSVKIFITGCKWVESVVKICAHIIQEHPMYRVNLNLMQLVFMKTWTFSVLKISCLKRIDFTWLTLS